MLRAGFAPTKHHVCVCVRACVLLKKRFIYFQIKGKGGRGRERNISVRLVASQRPPTGHLARNPGMCPDQGLNQ